MPADLRARADQAAKAAEQSLNAALVARLESSFLTEAVREKLLPAKRAKELALMAREGLSEEVRKRAIEAIGRAVRLGHSEAIVSLVDMHLEIGIPEDIVDEILNQVINELQNADQKVKQDDITTTPIAFE